MIVGIEFISPTGSKLQESGAFRNPIQGDGGGGHKRIVPAVFFGVSVRGIIPFIGICHHDRSLSKVEFTAALVTSSSNPPITIGIAPTSPFSHTVVLRISCTGNTAVVDFPTIRTFTCPCIVRFQSFVLVGSECQTLEIFKVNSRIKIMRCCLPSIFIIGVGYFQRVLGAWRER